jgi:hypothetical protein
VIVLPSPEDYKRMSWDARTRAVNTLLRAQRTRVKDITAQEWAIGVQDEARALLAAMPVDSEAPAHRRAIGGRS